MSEVAPVELLHVRDHAFVKQAKRGCGQCGRAKTHIDHMGAPPSLNVGGSGHNHFAYQNTKKAWQALFLQLLEASGLERPLARVTVEGIVCFPIRRVRDEGNHRFMLEKALGDALVEGGWLANDDWDSYSFGSLQRVHAKGESWTRLTVFPWPAVEEVAA